MLLVRIAEILLMCILTVFSPGIAQNAWCEPVQAHFVLDEMLMNGCIVETNKSNVLLPVQLLDRA